MKMNQMRAITSSFKSFAVGALALGFLAVASNAHAATTYNWTNTPTAFNWNEPTAWSPAGPPATIADTTSFSSAGALNVLFTNKVINTGSLFFQANAAGNTATVTFNLDTNSFTGYNAGNSSGSGFVIGGSAGTVIVYIASSDVPGAGFYATNSGLTTLRMTVGRNAAGTIAVTNGFVSAEALVMANTATGSGSKVVVSGAHSSWTNSGVATIGNVASANLNSIVVSNSGSMTIMGTFGVGPNTSGTNTVLVDSNGRLFTRGATTVGSGAGAVACSVTVQGGGLWDAGGRPVPFGAGG